MERYGVESGMRTWKEVLSWKISFPKEFTDLLSSNKYSYHIDNGTLIIDHKGYVDFPNLTTLPNNVQFNNRGNVYLSRLTTLPDNIQFNNGGYVNLHSLTTLPDNIQFNNEGYVSLYSLTTLPDNMQFNNEGWVHLNSLTTLPDNKEQIFKNYGYKIWYNRANDIWKVPNRVEGSKLESKLSWKAGPVKGASYSFEDMHRLLGPGQVWRSSEEHSAHVYLFTGKLNFWKGPVFTEELSTVPRRVFEFTGRYGTASSPPIFDVDTWKPGGAYVWEHHAPFYFLDTF